MKLKSNRKGKKRAVGADGEDDGDDDKTQLKIAFKCGDGKWSAPATIPDAGTSHGVIRVLSSRWPVLTRTRGSVLENAPGESSGHETGLETSLHTYHSACLDPDLFELCYTVSDVEGEWGEFSRSMVVSPRFFVRNDSQINTIEVKQTGASDSSSLKLSPGEVQPFYFDDYRLPGLVSVHPVVFDDRGLDVYKWSGGFDLSSLGMVPIRVRRSSGEAKNSDTCLIRSIRAIVEIRPGTGGNGINVSFKEENSSGDGSLFRIENVCPFPVWMFQDGVLANPTAAFLDKPSGDNPEIDGDKIPPSGRSAFALDVPYRQGKYAHRKAATMNELLHVRLALAPLSSRAGIETVKAISLMTVGASIRLNPSKLIGVLSSEMRASMQKVRILCIVTTDGPTRVLKFW